MTEPSEAAGPAGEPEESWPSWDFLDGDRDDPDWVPPVVDLTRPSAARMYDYVLGGKENLAVDRDAADAALQVIPDARCMAVANRVFLAHAVQSMARRGISQFLDLGSGLPTSPNVHETARLIQPEARVAYVDLDPIVLAHSRARLTRDRLTRTVVADLRQPTAVLDHPDVRELIDFDRPVGLLLIAVLHFVDHQLAPELLSHYVRRLAAGSMVAISTAQLEGSAPEAVAISEQVYAASPTPFFWRTEAQIRQLFEDLVLIEPGLTDVTSWHRNVGPGSTRIGCGVGVKSDRQ